MELADHGPAPRLCLGHGGHELHEERGRLGLASQSLAPRGIGRRPADGIARERQDGRAVADARRVGAHRERRVGLELRAARDGDVPVEEVHASAEVRGGALGPQAAPARGLEALEEALPGPRRDARVEVVVLHEPLGGARAVVAVAHRDRERLLLLEA